MTVDEVIISSRFCGPPQSGNGGYSCGIVANFVAGAATVRLKAPPPLDVSMRVEADGTSARLLHHGSLIAEARACDLNMDLPEIPDMACAEAATTRFRWFARHPFPTCFVCGNQRRPGEGMRIFPGVARPDGVMAAPWTPVADWADESGVLRPEFVWSALDCPGGFAVLVEGVSEGVAVLLGEMQARIDLPVKSGERCIIMSWVIDRDGRKRHAGTALVNAAGKVAAMARQTWVELPAAAVPGAAPMHAAP